MRTLPCLAVLALVASPWPVLADSPLGRWDATIELNGVVIPFRLEFSGEGNEFRGALFDGDRPTFATRSKLDGDSFTLDFDHYLAHLEGTLKGGRIEGSVSGRFVKGKYFTPHPLRATRHATASATAGEIPRIDGLWEIPVEGDKAEKSWRLVVHQDGAEVSAAILRVDGDTGTLAGSYRDGRWLLGHFSGARPLAVSIRPAVDGTLEVITSSASAPDVKRTAYRPADARSRGLPEPADPDAHTAVRQPAEPFRFQFPDLDGRTVSSSDELFRGKALIVVATGSWCPNCHDEAQFLVELDRKYRDRGLEVVALFFEESEQQSSLSRVRAFVKRYGVRYTTLLAGAPAEMAAKIPQAENLNTWPTTFFVGKDGLVKGVHTGFTSPGSGPLHEATKRQFEAKVEALLAEPLPKAR